MINLLILVILNSLLCNGLFTSWQFEFGYNELSLERGIDIDNKTKGILWWYKFYFLDKINYRASKPLGNCLVCMASVFSFVPYWMYYRFDFHNIEAWIFYPFYILILAGANRIIDKFVNE